MSHDDLLVVAGESSGDRAAAAVVRRLGGVSAFGIGGDALASCDVELTADIRDLSAMGIGAVLGKAGALARAFARILRAAKSRTPRAALLVDFTEFNARLAPRLRAMGVKVLWYGAPQVWAWRPGRADSIAKNVDHMAVMLPFEEEIWRKAGAAVSYVGHHALETPMLERSVARHALGMTDLAAGVALLPGSRAHEVKRLLPVMLEAFERVRSDRASVDARVLLAPNLDATTLGLAAELCAKHRVDRVSVDPQRGALRWLRAFDVALTASGTAALECALAEVPPVVAYKIDRVAELFARVMLTTRFVSLPNILLRRGAFPELLQDQVTATSLRSALESTLDSRDELSGPLTMVRAAFGDHTTPSAEVARILAQWLGLAPPAVDATATPEAPPP